MKRWRWTRRRKYLEESKREFVCVWIYLVVDVVEGRDHDVMKDGDEE